MKDNEQKAGEAVRAFLKLYHLEDKFTERELFARWEEMAGSAINNKTNKLRYRNGYLIVYLNSSTIRAEMNMRKRELIERINLKMRGEVVKDISFK